MKKLALVLVSSSFMISCSSFFIRKECEQVNWHQRGYDIAMSGKRVTGDEVIARCEKAEFDVPDTDVDLGFKAGMMAYCKPETAHQIGRDGSPFNADFCDTAEVRILRQRHFEGVKLYCQKDNGMVVGASGKKYTQICPKEMEEAFLVEYRKGRKKFLEHTIASNQIEIQTLDVNLASLRQEQSDLSYEMGRLPKPYTVTEKVYNAVTGTTTETSRVEDPARYRRSRLHDELENLSNRIRTQRDKQDSLRAVITESQKELVTLQ